MRLQWSEKSVILQQVLPLKQNRYNPRLRKHQHTSQPYGMCARL